MTTPDVIVVRGTPDDDELAALVAVLAALDARASAESTPDGTSNGRWTAGPAKPAYRPPNAWATITPR